MFHAILSRSDTTIGVAPHAAGEVLEQQLSQQSNALSVKNWREPVVSSMFRTFVHSRYTLPWEVLGLSRGSMHDMAIVTSRFYELFDAASNKGENKDVEQYLQVLCSAFLMLLLINANKTVTTHVTNNNLTVQASHITIMQEMDGLKSALAQRASQMEQWEFAWEETMKAVQREHDDQRDIISALEAELVVMQERAKCAPPCFDAVQFFLKHNCVLGIEERVGSAEFHAAFTSFIAHHQLDCEPPTQRELRALLETLGFHYDQVYIRGSNTRGFRGVSVKQLYLTLPDERL